VRYGGLDQKEELYIFVSDQEERERIKVRNSIWKPYTKGAKTEDVEIYEEYRQNGKLRQPTGCYKTIDIAADDYGKKKRMRRFYKRVGGKV